MHVLQMAHRRRRTDGWRRLTPYAGTVTAVLAILGAVGGFLRPSILAWVGAESTKAADAAHKSLEDQDDALKLEQNALRLEQTHQSELLNKMDGKLDTLIQLTKEKGQ